MPSVKLEGPYGIPPVPSSSVDAAVFIFGGVGITPALSLAAEASKFHGVKVPIYWGLRSLELLKRCAPMLEPHMDKELSTVVLNGQDVQAGGNALPLNARYGHEDVHSWLAEVSKRLSEKGVHRVMLFVCGPPGLAAAAKAAAGSKECNASVAWHLHVEEFLFLPPLPKMPKCGSRKRTAVSAATKPTLLGSQPTA
ncbi:unnamed protein product [Polarella glacialis]|uniref:Ferric reductase NAD binding domain-containing protein n=1 Tax=Polarella glacialis TaxID=89957 RepID=A0A813D8H9_POLGL|nr:unnamed protein product [Polarella glacialis]